MNEEAIVRIAETLESIKDAIWLMAGMTICLFIVFGVAFLLYIIARD